MKTHFYTEDIVNICDKKHLTVDEIFNLLKITYPEVGRSSIYRNVEQLVEKWELKKVVWIWNKAYFEKNIGKHIHLIDEKTGDITDLEINNIKIPDLPQNFNVNNMDIRIYWDFS